MVSFLSVNNYIDLDVSVLFYIQWGNSKCQFRAIIIIDSEESPALLIPKLASSELESIFKLNMLQFIFKSLGLIFCKQIRWKNYRIQNYSKHAI